VLPGINRVADLGGKIVAVPFWAALHNIVLTERYFPMHG